ncbi:MAG: hypothetical protein JO089_04330, partial [Alphaproteobacteria bacterium]|nr:hypothetical protein [Alphaproteobacteria bacterium]
MPDPSKEAFAELFIIAHAVNDAVDAKIAELKAYKGGGSPGWEMEDYYRNQRELQEMRNAKAFTEALLLFAGKDGQLDPVETERVGFALATEPHLYDDPPKLSFFLFKPGDMDKLMQRFLGNHTEQIDARIASKGRAEINTGKAFEDAMAAIKTTPPTVVLENFLKVVPFISEKMRALAEPTIELRQIVDKITKPAYRQNEFITADLMNVSMHFSDLRYNHFKDSPPPELMKIEQEYNQWDEAVRLTNRNDRPF